jgi:GNAT superfamily N-acetyltransferase/predicted ABC-type ATPase
MSKSKQNGFKNQSIKVASDNTGSQGVSPPVNLKRRSRAQIKEQILTQDPTRDYASTRYSYYGELFVQNLPLWRLWTARMMLTSDPIINFSMNIRNAALMATQIKITAKSPKVKVWLAKQWHTLWNYHRPKLLSSKKWGFAALQCVCKLDKATNLIDIKDLKDFAPEDARALQVGNKLCGMRVKGQPVFFPQALWLTFGAEFGGSYGTAITRRQYPAWYEKWMDHGAKRLLQLRMIKDSYIGDIFWYPPNITAQLPDGTSMPWRDLMREIGENRLSGGALTLPRLLDSNGKELTGYQPPQAIPGATEIFSWVEDCDDNILKGADIPVEVVQAADTGSGFSGRSIPFLVLLSVCNNEIVEIVQCIVQQVLRPLAWLNWGGDVEFEMEPLNLVQSFAGDIQGSAMAGGSIGGQTQQPQEQAPAQQPPSQDSVQFGEDNPHKAFVDRIHNEHPGVSLDLSRHSGHKNRHVLVLHKIVVPKEHRGQGIGTTVMRKIGEHADKHGATVALSPDTSFGGSKERLHKFYKGLGYKDNTGRNADHSLSESMYRNPNEQHSEDTRGPDMLPGGKGDKKHDLSKFDPEQLAAGIKVEMEHTSDPRIALEICIDHLTEDSHYYTKLAKIDKGAKEALQYVEDDWTIHERGSHGVATGWKHKSGATIKKTVRPKTRSGLGGIRHVASHGNEEYSAITLESAKDWVNSKTTQHAENIDFKSGEDAYHHLHAPPGGVTIHGVPYEPGEFIPKEVVNALSPEEKSKLRAGSIARHIKARPELAEQPAPRGKMAVGKGAGGTETTVPGKRPAPGSQMPDSLKKEDQKGPFSKPAIKTISSVEKTVSGRLGDCYESAFNELMYGEGTKRMEEVVGAEAKLIHGYPTIPSGPNAGKKMGHAWVQIGDDPGLVLDHGNLISASHYYRVGKIDLNDISSYSRSEAFKQILKVKKWGPFENKVEEAIFRESQGLSDLSPKLKKALDKVDQKYPAYDSEGKTTKQRYMDQDGAITPERKRLHNNIIKKQLEGHQSQEEPLFILMGGGPAAGKSRILTSGIFTLPKDHVLVTNDEYKPLFPEYQMLLKHKDNRAAAYVHEESGVVTKAIFKASLKAKNHVVLDGTGNNGLESLKEKVDVARTNGHKVVGHYVTCDISKALARSIERERKTGRNVPEAVLKENHRNVSQVIPLAVKEGLFDELHLWDTNEGDTPIPVMSAFGKNMVVHNNSLWTRFLEKGKVKG